MKGNGKGRVLGWGGGGFINTFLKKGSCEIKEPEEKSAKPHNERGKAFQKKR